MIFKFTGATRPPFYRLLHIDRKIKSGVFPNCRTLAEELEVHQRTISRDVDFIKNSLNAPLEYCARNRGFYYTEANYSMGLLKLTEGELLALYLGHNLLARCKGTPYIQPVINAFNKICCYLQETVNIDFGRLSDTVEFDLEPLRGEEKQVASHFEVISKAINKQQTIRLLHYAISRDNLQERLVDPYQLRYYQGAWYLVGYCHLRQALRFFALDRIRELHPTSSSFSLPADFNPEKYFQDTFRLFKGSDIQTVSIWFSPDQARWIREKRWHSTQEIEENPDGSLILTIQTSGLFQVKRWVLSFGAEAKVLEPPGLASEVAHELASARELYRQGNNVEQKK